MKTSTNIIPTTIQSSTSTRMHWEGQLSFTHNLHWTFLTANRTEVNRTEGQEHCLRTEGQEHCLINLKTSCQVSRPGSLFNILKNFVVYYSYLQSQLNS